jgi:hypothetical protein
MLPMQNINKIKNKKVFIAQMMTNKPKFRSLGMLLFHLINETSVFKNKKFFF